MVSVVEGIERLPVRHTIVLLHAVEWFSDRPEYAKLMCDVLLRRDDAASLRSIDAFVTKTCRQDAQKLGHLFDDYRRHLASFSKRLFDPFARRDRVVVRYGRDMLSTTVGQLNFLRWWIESGVYCAMTTTTGQAEGPAVVVAAGFIV